MAAENKEQYALKFLNTVPFPVCIMHDGIFVFCNRPALRMTGRSMPDIINKRVTDIFVKLENTISAETPPPDIPGAPAEYTCRIKTKQTDGILKCIEHPVVWQGRKSTAMYFLQEPAPEDSDIESGSIESDFKAMFEHAPAGMYRTTPEGRIVLANSELVSMLGYLSFAELAATNVESDHTFIDYPRSEFKARLEKQGLIRGLETRWKKKDGSYIHVRECARLVRDSNGHPAYYDGIVEDFTDRIREEQKLQREQQSIRRLSQAAMQLVACPPEQDIYFFIGQQIKKIIGPDSYVVINSVDPVRGGLRLRAVLGFGRFYTKLVSMFGVDPKKMTFNVDDKGLAYIKDGRLHDNERDLYSILQYKIPEKITVQLQRLLRLSRIYTIGLISSHQVLGTVLIGTKSNYSGRVDPDTVEVFVRQAAISIQRRQAEERIKHLNCVLQAIQAIDQIIISEKDRETLISQVCSLLVEKRGYSSAWIVLLDTDQHVQMHASSGLGSKFSSVLKLFTQGRLIECSRRALSASGCVYIQDTRQECGSCPLQGAEPSERTFTIRLEHAGRIYGLMSMSVPLDLSVDKQEQSLFEEFAADLSFALYRIQLEEDNTQAQRALLQSEDKLSKIMLAANDGTWDWDLKTNEVFFDARYYQMAGYDVDEFPHRLEEFQNRIHPDDVSLVMGTAEKHLDGKIPRFSVEFRFRAKNGEWMWIKGRGLIVERDKNGTPLRFVGTHTDITERKQIEQALIRSEEKYRTIFESSSDAVFTMKNSEFIDCNESTLRMFKCSREDIIGKTPGDFSPDTQPDGRPSAEAAQENINAALEGIPQFFEWQHMTADGTVFHAEVNLNRFELGSEYYIQAAVRSIEERKKAELALKKSLAEKDVLIKEIHHRVKNNLQVVHSLLGLQENSLDDKRAVELFEETRGRVYVMARVHEMLYRSEDFSEINFKEYLELMTREMLSSSTVSGKITFKQDIDDICISIDLAIPCGLILNELMTNALKHGFSGREQGELSVSFKRKGKHKARMQVSDNGVGFPDTVDFNTAKTFGLRLVTILTEQLEGSLSIERDKGTAVVIEFPLVS